MAPDETIDLLFAMYPGLGEKLRGRLYDRRTVTATNCWVSTDNVSGKGYARVSIDLDGTRRRIRSHRLSYHLHKGSIPENTMVLHTCDNTLCWNPDHLFLGDAKANIEDRILKGRFHPQAAKLTNTEVARIREMHANGWDSKNIAAQYSVHYTTIRDIINGRYHNQNALE